MNLKLGMTGISGWIGCPLRQFLEHAGHEVLPLDAWTRGVGRPASDIGPKPLDWVLHLGAKTCIEESWADPFDFYTNNLGATLVALELARASGASFLYLSSYVYGPAQSLPVDETHPVQVSNPYMASKLLCEQACQTIAGQEKINYVILRAFNIYGPGQKKGRLVSDLLDQARTGGPLRLNDPDPRRDYLFIDDFCDLIGGIITHHKPASGVYNVGSGQSHSNAEVAAFISELAGGLAVEAEGRPRAGDVMDCTMTPAKVSKEFNWSPAHTLSQGLAKLLVAPIV